MLVTVTDELPAGVTYGGASGDGWSCSHAGGTVTCAQPDLRPAGVAPSIAITVTAPEDIGTITNRPLSPAMKWISIRSDPASAETLVKAVHYIYLPVVLRSCSSEEAGHRRCTFTRNKPELGESFL